MTCNGDRLGRLQKYFSIAAYFGFEQYLLVVLDLYFLLLSYSSLKFSKQESGETVVHEESLTNCLSLSLPTTVLNIVSYIFLHIYIEGKSYINCGVTYNEIQK